MDQAVITRTEQYDEEGNLTLKWWNVQYAGVEYGPFYSYDDAEVEKWKLIG